MRPIRQRFRRLAVEPLEPRLPLAFGDLDPTFGIAGITTTEISVDQESLDLVTDVAKAPDGKYVAVGSTQTGRGNNLAVARFLADGTLDATFGSEGKVLTAISYSDDLGAAVAVQSDGKVVVGGVTRDVNTFFRFLLTRYLSDGSLDATFGSNGVVTTPVGPFHSEARDLLIQPDGKILLAGYGYSVGQHLAVARYDSEGVLDPLFGIGGIASIAVTGVHESATSIALDASGKILVAGYSFDGINAYRIVLARLQSNGTPDLGFGSAGVRLIPFSTDVGLADWPNPQLAQQSDGKIILSAAKPQPFLSRHLDLFRLLPGGDLDPTFGSGGLVTDTRVTVLDNGSYPLLIHNDTILVGGREGTHSGDSRLAMLRFTSNGVRDATFGVDGLVTDDLGYRSFDQPLALVLEASGGWTAATEIYSASGPLDFGLARFGAAGNRDLAFGAGGLARANFATEISPAEMTDSTIDFNGKVVSISNLITPFGFPGLAITRHTPDGSLDPTFGVNGVVRLEPTETHGYQDASITHDAQGRLYVQGRLQYTDSLFLARLLPGGAPDPAFGSAGFVSFGSDDRYQTPTSLVPQADGKLIAAGWIDERGYLLRLNPSGTPDLQFGVDGRVELEIAGGRTTINSVAVQRDGKLVAVGESQPPAAGGRVVMTAFRMHPDGSLDHAFGTGGVAFIDIPSGFSFGQDAALLRDGRMLLAGGISTFAGTMDMVVARLLPDGKLDPAFGIGGTVQSNLAGDDFGSSLAVYDTGRFLVGGFASPQAGRDLLVAAFRADGTPDVTLWTGGILAIPLGQFHDAAVALRLQTNGDIVGGGTATTETARLLALVRIQGEGVTQLPYQNLGDPLNTEDDDQGAVVALDALLIINELNINGSRRLSAPDLHRPPPVYFDVDGDNHVSPLDALLVINHLNLPEQLLLAEGEAPPLDAASAAAVYSLLADTLADDSDPLRPRRRR